MSRFILMLEHDDDDRYITQTVFGENNFDVRIDFVSAANELFSCLDQCEARKTRLPSLILLNYHAKPISAIEVLKQLKLHASYRKIPVVVLSGSVKAEIVTECYQCGASSFIQKPSKAGETEEKIKNFFRYWFETVLLP